MDKALTILLVEDEPADCEAIVQYIETLEDVLLVGVTNNATKALELLQDTLPDAIILDLELHKGSGTGLGFLGDMKNLYPPVCPYVLVTTHNISAVTHDNARQLGADFILVKSQTDYSAERVVDFLRVLRGTIQRSTRALGKLGPAGKPESPREKKKRIVSRIETELDLLGVSPKAVGRQYLIDAIVLITEGFQQSVYPQIAHTYRKSDASVERAMQNAINGAWRHTNIDDLQKRYTARIGSAKGVPTVTEFIWHYASRIKSDY